MSQTHPRNGKRPSRREWIAAGHSAASYKRVFNAKRK